MANLRPIPVSVPVTLVHCGACINFMRRPITSEQAAGDCKAYEDYKALKPSAHGLQNAWLDLGGSTFYPGHEPYRKCKKFIKK